MTRQPNERSLLVMICKINSGLKPKERVSFFICRSTAMGRYHFYTNQKALVHDIIMYHLPVFPDQVRIGIATFATDIDVIVDGISSNPITKCDIFEENGYWDKVLYKVQYIESNGKYTLNHTLTDGTYVDLAYSMAEDMLLSGVAYYDVLFLNGYFC